MKKIILMFLTAAFVLALGSCEQPKDKDKKHKSSKEIKKNKHERRW